MNNLKNGEKLQPQLLWKNFDKILGISHPSYNPGPLADSIYDFGKSLWLETIKDDGGNVLIRKPATSQEMAKKKMITLQAHMDMVPQKDEGKIHDFTKDAIKAYVDGDFVKAEGTTLGADNGMGMAAIMAILESKDIEHGPLEALFTVDEEVGMHGVKYLKADFLKGKYLINLDSEDEGEIFIGCAGGVDVTVSFDYKKENAPTNYNSYRVVISGLKGGHSGFNIHEGRGNAIKILTRLLFSLKLQVDFYLSEFNGGTLRNVIPSKAEVVLLVNNKDDKKFKDIVSDFSVMIKKEYKFGAPFITLTLNESKNPPFVFDKKTSNTLIDSIHCCVDGAIRMDDNLNIVQTSSSLGVINTTESSIYLSFLSRSLIDTARDYVATMVGTAFSIVGANVKYSGVYPGWKPDENSTLLKVSRDTYRELFGKDAKVLAVHAGLECGVIGAKYPKMEMISFGPTIKDAHSINERVEIKSVERFFAFLCEVIKKVS